MKMYIFYTSCLMLTIFPWVFIINAVYKDGVLGRTALGAISAVSASFLMEAIDGHGYDVLPQTVALIASFAVFLVWHLWRFHRRVLYKNKVQYPPDCPVDRRRVERRFTA